MSGPVVGDDTAALADALDGELLLPDEPGYDEARQLHNGSIDRRPALIARCRSGEDAARVLAWSVERGLGVTVRVGGHGVHGRALSDNGVVLDLRELNTVTVDPDARTATVAGGALWQDVYPQVARHGLGAVGGTVGTVGVAGLVTGGGFGWLTRRHGYAADNVAAFAVLGADGQVRRVSPDEHPELFWALRGAGGAGLGVILSTTLQLHPVAERVVAGTVMYDVTHARVVLDRYLAFMRDAGPDTNAIWIQTALPNAPFVPNGVRGRTVVMVALCHLGSGADAEDALRPLRTISESLLDDVVEMGYADMQRVMGDGIPSGLQNFWRSGFVSELPDAAARALLEAAQAAPGVPVQVWEMGPALGRLDEQETAAGRTGRAYFVGAPSMWPDPAANDAMRAATESVLASVAPWRSASCPNHSGPLPARELGQTFGAEKLGRLLDVKARHDPDGVFSGPFGLLAAGAS